jgi:DNA-binding NtrC family response regulator
MKTSSLDRKRILAVDDEPDILTVLEEEILDSCSNCVFDKATRFEEACGLIESRSYDVVILDIMGVRGFDLLALAVSRNLKVVMLTAHALTAGNLRRSFEMKALAYLPKQKLGEIVPFLEDALRYDFLTGWKRLMSKLGGLFSLLFGPEWEKEPHLLWDESKTIHFSSSKEGKP